MREVQQTTGVRGQRAHHQVMLVSGIGAGKTTLTTTLPGRKFYYFFDPNGLAAVEHVRGIEYVEFLPEAVGELDLAAKTLKSITETKMHDKPSIPAEPKLYLEWEADFQERRRTKFFDKFNWIIIDSATSFQDAIYDRVQFLNGRLGKQPEEADHAGQMTIFRKDMRAMSTLTNVCITCHIETQKDGLDGRIYGRILMTGKNRLRVPSLFAHIFACEVADDGKYMLVTRPTRMHPVVRTAIPGLKLIEDVTIDYTKPLDGQGLARVLKPLNLQSASADGATTR